MIWYKKKSYNNGLVRYCVKSGSLPCNKSVVTRRGIHWYFNAERSARRVRAVIEDLSNCNTFSFFVTFTFSSDREVVSDRLNDDITRDLFAKWRKDIRRRFPDLTYIAVPEYHKKGGLHYHMVVGGVTADELGLVYAQQVYCKSTGEMIPCYNVCAWKYGYSTATLIQGDGAVIRYLMKYITKGAPDPRFFRKKRFTCSHNILRPLFEARDEDFCGFDFVAFCEETGMNPKYFDYSHGYFLYE